MFEKFLFFITIIILLRFAIPCFFFLVSILLYGITDIVDKIVNKFGFLRDNVELLVVAVVTFAIICSGFLITGGIVKILEVIY